MFERVPTRVYQVKFTMPGDGQKRRRDGHLDVEADAAGPTIQMTWEKITPPDRVEELSGTIILTTDQAIELIEKLANAIRHRPNCKVAKV